MISGRQRTTGLTAVTRDAASTYFYTNHWKGAGRHSKFDCAANVRRWQMAVNAAAASAFPGRAPRRAVALRVAFRVL